MTKEEIEQLKRDIEFDADLGGVHLRLCSTWGLFSPRQIDDGTALMLRYLDVSPNEQALDLGCGYGPLGLAIAKKAPQGFVHLVDKDFVAVEYANKNAKINHIHNCKAYLSNGLAHVPSDAKFSLVVSNIPAKVGKELLNILLWDIKERLNPGGRVMVVTISGLREFMKRNFNDYFGNYEKVKQGKDYTVSMAVKE